MEVESINPFVRYAGRIVLNYTPLRIARDNRIFYIPFGKTEFEIGGEKYFIESKALIFIPSGTPYSFNSVGKCELYALNFDFSQTNNTVRTIFATVTEDVYKSVGKLEEVVFENKFFSEPMVVPGGIFEHQISNLVSEFTLKKIFFYEKSSAILKDILFDLLRLFNTEGIRKNNSADSMIEYIHENYMNPITNKDIASIVGYHEYHANRLMLRHTGMTIHKYLNNFRMERAKILLVSTDFSVGEIAEKSGLGSVSRFSESFRKSTGVSPAVYRKENFRLI